MKTTVRTLLIVIPILLVALISATYAMWFQAESQFRQRQEEMKQIVQGGFTPQNNQRFCELVRSEPRLLSQSSVAAWAAEHGDRLANELVIQRGSEVLNPSFPHEFPVEYAMWRGDPAILDMYLSAGVDPNGWNSTAQISFRVLGDGPLQRSSIHHREPLLHAACRMGNLEVVELLLRHGADIQARNEIGDTCLFTAAEWKRPEAVRLLLSHGIDPKLQDKEGHTVEGWLRVLKVDGENAERWPELDEVLAILVHWREHGELP